VSTVLHYLIWAAFAALFVGVVVVAVKAVSRGKSVGGTKADRAVGQADDDRPAPSRPQPAPRPRVADVDDELARLKREMGN
jgi:hypothetical protein